MIEVSSALFLFGFVILIGYFALKLFEHAKIPDIIILILLGLLIGPLYNFFGTNSVAAFRTVMPFVSAMALIIILFEAGFNLNLFKVLRTLSIATIFTILVSGLSVIGVSAAAYFLLGWPLLVSLLLGVIIGGTDSAVIMSLIGKTSASEDTKMLIFLETAINDTLIVFAFALAGIIKAQDISLQIVGQQILGAFSIAAIVGFIVAMFWLNILQHGSRDKKYDYLLTIAVLSMLYAFVEYFHANGAVAAFVFGIVLGNSKEITTMLKMAPKPIDCNIALFQQELSFFVRTFFFVYLGVIFDKGALTAQIGLVALVLMAIIIAVRFFSARLVAKHEKKYSADVPLISFSLARGISAAVLASVPLGLGLGETANTIFYLTFLVILLSNVVTAIGIFSFERKKQEPNAGGKENSALTEIKV